jgi:hypothetical protein
MKQGLIALSLFICAALIMAPQAHADSSATLTVSPSLINLATTKDLFTCLVALPVGHTSEINPFTVRLSLPDCPGCAEAEPSSITVITEYTFQFERSFLRQVPLGEVALEVSGLLQDGTPFLGTATVQTWKPLASCVLTPCNAMGQPESQFAAKEPVVLSCDFQVDELAGTGLKAQLVVTTLGRQQASPWLPVRAGDNHLGLSLLIPAKATPGAAEIKATLRLRKNGKLYDTAAETMPIEVLEHSKMTWQP